MITNAGQSNISNSGINYRPALIILTFLFFIWGGITSLNDVLIPHLKDIFELNYFTAMLVQFAFFAAYFVMGYPAGWIIGRIGYKKGLVLGLGVTGLGAAMFYPAAEFQVFALFLIGFFTLASGITVLQTAANPYVAILGTPDSASARLNLSQAFASLGTIIFPIVGAFFILQSSLNLSPEQKAELVQVPYLGIALALVLMAVVLAFSKLPKIGDRSKEDLSGTDDSVSAWRFTHLVLGAIALFFYAGAEVSIGSFFINYMGADGLNTLPKSADAGKFLALYWGGAMVGRFLGAILLKKSNAWSKIFGVLLVYLLGFFLAVMTTQGIGGFFEAIGRFNLVALGKWFELGLPAAITFMALVVVNTLAFLLGNKKPHVTLAVFAAIAIGLLTLSMTNNDNLVFYGTSINLAMWAVVGLGLFNSVMFPNIFTLGLRDLGKSTGQGSGILVMALVGGAVLPLLMGLMADSFSLRLAFVVPLVGYVYILYYGIDGYRLRQQTVSVGITDAAIGIDIGSNTTKIGIADKNGNVLEKAEFQTNNFPSPEELVVGIHRAIEELLQKTDHAVDIKGVGVAVSGGNFYNGTIDNPINLPYEGVIPIVALMQKRISLPIVLTNDANAAALGEKTYGGAMGMENFILLTLGEGLGSGIIVNGQLMYGKDGHAGELGHVSVQADGRECSCGKRGCLQTYVSANGLIRTVQSLLADSNGKSRLSNIKPDELTGEMIYAAANDGDPIAVRAFEQTGETLGNKLADTVAHLNPEAIFLTGGLALAGDLLFEPVRIALVKNILPIYAENLELHPSILYNNAGILGAAALVWQEVAKQKEMNQQ